MFISGAGVAADDWSYVGDPTDASEPATPDPSAVFPETARFTTACAYDRPGTEQMEGAAGRSTPVPQPTTSQQGAADLHAVLTTAEVPGPYVLVGHSLGGMIATTYARTYPDEVSGVVLVDPGSQYLQTALPPDVWSKWMADIAAAGAANPESEAPDYPASIAALEATPPLPAGIPVVVLSADRPFDYLGIGDADAYWPNWLEAGVAPRGVVRRPARHRDGERALRREREPRARRRSDLRDGPGLLTRRRLARVPTGADVPSLPSTPSGISRLPRLTA